jgi:Gram-negative bacterial TonB protein C-terminal
MCKFSTALVLCLLAPTLDLSAQGKPPVLPPRLISIPTPDCKSGRACHGSHGQVRLIIDVLETGKAGDIRAEVGESILVDAATAAAQQAEFVPGSFQGKPTLMSYVLTLNF